MNKYTIKMLPTRRWLWLILLSLSFAQMGCDDQAVATTTVTPKTWHLPITEVLVKTLPVNYSTTGSIVLDQRIEITSRTTG